MSRLSLLVFAFLIAGIPCRAQDAIFRTDHIFRPVSGTHGAIAAGERRAAEAGLAVLERGGNAIDAAVTVGFTLAVTYPRAGNIGGGGFMLIHEGTSGETHALDYREVAPAAASRDMFLNDSGEADPDLSQKSPISVGIPGTVAGLLAAHERFGTLPLAELMEPAIRLARDGFTVNKAMAADFAKAGDINRLKAAARRVFFGEDNLPPVPGERLVQPELAASLERIANHGRNGFYTGPTAEAIVATLAANGGLLTLEDLSAYSPIWRQPVSGVYKGHTILSMPPPSSGGIHLIQMLHLIENLPIHSWGHNSGQYAHMLAEVMKRAYADRSKFLGDPDFAEVPQEKLLSEEYEQLVLGLLNSMTPTPSQFVRPGPVEEISEPTQTTHFSIVDAHGNAVSNTTTLNFSFGSGILAEGTGILLNNQMDDFTAKPGTPNAYGLIGGEMNTIQPGKRMLSSMTPTIVLKDDKVRIVTGSPGGSRIITTVLQVVMNVIDFEMNAAEAVNSPRFHHQWLPDVFETERGFPSESLEALRYMGYKVEVGKTIGAAQTILCDADGTLSAAGDPRREDASAVAF